MIIKKVVKKLVEREWVHPRITYPLHILRVIICKWRYHRIISRMRARRLRGRIRIVFLVSSVAKWKCQSLYEELTKTDRYDPIIALTITDEDRLLSNAELKAQLDESRMFFESHKNKCIIACEIKTRRLFSLKDLHPDIVFFQVPWGLYGSQTVWNVSKYALTCYMPYGIENIHWKNRTMRFDYQHIANFHLLLYLNFAWCEMHAKHYISCQYPWEMAGKIIGVGHTALDSYSNCHITQNEKVIYAPHFSFKWNDYSPILRLSTFPNTGRFILDYAKSHPEQKWVFKPHPLLKTRLYECGFMTKEAVENYYREWETVGEACYDSDYYKLFCQSRALVTDCCSFLTEYLAVKKPLIRLVPDDINTMPVPAAKEMFDTFYNVYDIEQLKIVFRDVIENGADPLHFQRERAIKNVNVFGQSAALKIIAYFNSILDK